MNKTVPTLLGVAIILLVVILVLSLYHMTMLTRLAEGERVVGTTAQKLLGGQLPSEEISASEVLAAHMADRKRVSAAELQAKSGRVQRIVEQQNKRQASRGKHPRSNQAARKTASLPGQ